MKYFVCSILAVLSIQSIAQESNDLNNFRLAPTPSPARPVYGPQNTEEPHFDRCAGLAGEQLPSCFLGNYPEMFAEQDDDGSCGTGFKVADLNDSAVLNVLKINARPHIEGAPQPLSDFTERTSGNRRGRSHSGPALGICVKSDLLK